ncbi:hypothetical protein [Notoacmeibacter ruber]|uniref:Uncharacterized protein n=1 Tax=Notoacmeibacter ruber TaxID=2670375 RepID=A0A3L7JKC2_9HYPH|nr:hypothetical protein [Notoacmeibacter ruber]RLQ88932.1 hypothetical protein D8780_12530 [Notoacmeibacter ruber]
MVERPCDNLAYIHGMLLQLREMAIAADADVLTYHIEMTIAECADTRRQRTAERLIGEAQKAVPYEKKPK